MNENSIGVTIIPYPKIQQNYIDAYDITIAMNSVDAHA